MKIYKFSKVISLPFVIVSLFFIVQVIRDSGYEHLVWIIVPVTFLVLIYLFQPQLDYWWLKRNPIELDDKISSMISKINPGYQQLSKEDKAEFGKRLVLFAEAKEFLAKGEEDVKVPYDVRMMLSQVAIKMTWNSHNYMLEKFERVVLYKHPFPSPRFPFLHTVETHAEDGVIILSIEHVEAGLFHPDNYYNIAGHAFAEAFVKSNPAIEYPQTYEKDWNEVNQLCGYGKKEILTTLGFKQIDLLIVLINLYFSKTSQFRVVFPEYAKTFEKIFSEN